MRTSPLREGARARVRRSTTRGADRHRRVAAVAGDCHVTLTGTQLRRLTNRAADYRGATTSIVLWEGEWISGYTRVRYVTRIGRRATRRAADDRVALIRSPHRLMTL